MTPWGAVIMQLQKPYRRGEYAACLQFYLDAGIPIYDLVTAGNVEGGDFMVLKPGVAVCGFSGERSIEPAVRQLQSWFEAEGWEFHTYAFDSHFLHLDVQMGMIAEGPGRGVRGGGRTGAGRMAALERHPRPSHSLRRRHAIGQQRGGAGK
jgi:N-dimethylarginine dimethylaminohydrolase